MSNNLNKKTNTKNMKDIIGDVHYITIHKYEMSEVYVVGYNFFLLDEK